MSLTALSLLALVLALPFTAPSAATGAQLPSEVACEFRAFDGITDVSAATRIRVYPAGRREGGGTTVQPGTSVPLEPGYYDVQFVQIRDDRVLNIRWLEHTLVQRYPGDRYGLLEVMNFQRSFGALQLILPSGAPSLQYKAEAFAATDTSKPVADTTGTSPYLVLALPAGRYDVRVRPLSAPAQPVQTGWVLQSLQVMTDRVTTTTVGNGGAGGR